MTHHILCAIDLNHKAESRAVLAEAGRLASFSDASMSVITVLPDYGSSWVGSFFQPGTLKSAAEATSETLHDVVKEVLPEFEHIQHIVEIGSPYEKVLEAIDTTNADLVVLGAHKPDLADRILGPNAARIIRHSKVSTYVVRLKG